MNTNDENEKSNQESEKLAEQKPELVQNSEPVQKPEPEQYPEPVQNPNPRSKSNQETKPEEDTSTAGGEHKLTKKQFVLREARAVLFMILYLIVSLSLLATFRCLVLIQHGINDFVHSYVVAVVLAIALGKIVVICQKLPVVNALNQRPLVWSVLYKSAVMTLIANLGSKAEEHLFPALHAPTGSTEHQMILTFTRQMALFFVFVVLFTWRDLDRTLGHGTLFKLFFFPRQLALKDSNTGDSH